MNIDYTKITAADLLHYFDRTHPVGGKGNCICSTCEAYGIICHAVADMTRRRAAANNAKNNQAVAVTA